jgi:hypothetical protein
MRFLKLALAALLLGVQALAALAQTYPTTSPVYIPQAVLASWSTLTGTGVTTNFVVNGSGTMLIRVAGTFSVLAAQVQVTEQPATTASPTWTAVPVETVGGPRVGTITATGLYRLNVAGAKQVRVNVSSLTGTNVIFSAAAGSGDHFVSTLSTQRQTYSATVVALAAATSATDFLTITGNASTTVRLLNVTCSATGTVGAVPLVGIVRSSADSGGTSSTVTAVANDQNDAAAQAVVKSYTVNPSSLGTAVGTVRAGVLTVTPASSTTVGAQEVSWDFGIHPGEQEVVLRGTSQVFAVNGNGSFAASTLPTCSLTWTEE